MKAIAAVIVFGLLSAKLTESAFLGVCYGVLGCFNVTEDFQHILYRPINLLPQNPDIFETRILLFTRTKRSNALVVPRKWINSYVNADKLDAFGADKPSKFIVHGFMDDPTLQEWQSQTKNELLTNGDYNVFVVDWSEANSKWHHLACNHV